MTIDDDRSIYIGGLPYNASEDTLRRVFNLYGSIVAVKIINNNGPRGKCYGFVTFRNPRSVIDAINDMNGKTIDRRVVRVNGVTGRGGKSNFTEEDIRSHLERDRERGRDRDYDHDRDKHQQWHGDRSRERDRSWGYDEDSERGYEHTHLHDRAGDGFYGRDRSRERELENNEQEKERKSDKNKEKSHALDGDRDWEMCGTISNPTIVDKASYQNSRKMNGYILFVYVAYLSCHSLVLCSIYNDQHKREISSDSSDDYHDEVNENLERSTKKHDELQNKVSHMEERLENKQQFVSDLQKKALILEGALLTAKKLSSQRRMQLTKLQKCFLQTKEYSNRLKSCEQELKVTFHILMHN
ncbi:hypothetical protein DKX38_028140 [Salix brachista]|uniref:RRM domain-containing protein n=1 Tax=Salix brachista TaxID=2182728 RepID=A0A5N5J8L9_9ROSI|nr:hypothetical protein DKX38_028140 [Salix brachista]